MHRPVGRGVRDVHEERLARVVARVVGDKAGGVIADRVRVIELPRPVFGIRIRRYQGVVPREGVGIEEAARAVNGAVEPVKAALSRPVGLLVGRGRIDVLRDVPLAHHVGAVTGGLEGLGDRDTATIQLAAIAVGAAIVHHVSDAGLMRIKPGEQRGARRAAAGRVVELRETHPALRQRVEVRRLDLTTVGTEVGVPHVVGHDDDDIRPRRGSGETRRPEQGSQDEHGQDPAEEICPCAVAQHVPRLLVWGGSRSKVGSTLLKQPGDRLLHLGIGR